MYDFCSLQVSILDVGKVHQALLHVVEQWQKDVLYAVLKAQGLYPMKNVNIPIPSWIHEKKEYAPFVDSLKPDLN